jgi:hypothetical protein
MTRLKEWWESIGSWYVRLFIVSIGFAFMINLMRAGMHSLYSGKPAQFEWDAFLLSIAIIMGLVFFLRRHYLRRIEAEDSACEDLRDES